MIAADFANFARIPTDADIAALKALCPCGLDHKFRVIIGTSFGTVADAQIAACVAAGFEVQEYQFPEALRITGRAWWLDVEISPNHVPTQDEVRAACLRLIPPIGIYTSRSQWDALWPSWDIVAEFPWLLLWTANYGPLPRPFTPYGGWTSPTMTQYAGTTDVGTGFEVDLSEYEEEQMDQQTKDAIAAILQQQGVLGTKIDALEASTKYLISVVVNVAGRVSTLEGK